MYNLNKNRMENTYSDSGSTHAWHFVFIYCDTHDQGAVALLSHYEWLGADGDESNRFPFQCVSGMCGNSQTCCHSWRRCGYLEYNPETNTIAKKEDIQTNFEREGGGWEFKYFKNEIFTIYEQWYFNKLPDVVQEYLAHLD